jgi:Reverse transcriptase (RNA-dependent DNA polymerase)
LPLIGKKHNLILNLKINGQLSVSLPLIEQHILEFYKQLFGEAHDKKAFLYNNFWDDKFLVHESSRLIFKQPFTLEELKEVVFGSNSSGAPGPDGFSFAFYPHFLVKVQDDLMLLLQHFYNISLKTAKLNHAMVCLLPKENDATVIQKFRPISLVDCSYKIISKVLTNRLSGIVNDIVDEAQTSFIQGKFILDNVLAAHEIIYYVKLYKHKGIIFKVNFEKSYDRISWSFLKELLLSRRFGPKWTAWIDNMLMGAQTCIKFNGNLTPYFSCKRGLRQGDPLSPFILDLVTDALCQLLIRGRDASLIQVPVFDNGHRIINFHYDDDTIFFS